MTIWETVKADPFVWLAIALFVVTPIVGAWRAGEWLIKRRRK